MGSVRCQMSRLGHLPRSSSISNEAEAEARSSGSGQHQCPECLGKDTGLREAIGSPELASGEVARVGEPL